MSTSNKKRNYASNALLYTVFVAGVVVVINLISTRVFGRIDLTEKHVYTLSQASKDLVKKLPDYLTVKAFISNDLPPEIKTLSRYTRDLIDEYKTSSNGKFRWDAVDPAADKSFEEEANRCKVQKLQVQVMRGSKFELGAYYMGLCLQYGDKMEAIPQVARAEGLEYQVSSLIKKLTVKKKKIAFTTGHGELGTSQGFQALKQDLEQEYDIASVNPSSAEIGADVDALVVAGPKQPIDEKGQREIDRFLMTGKGAVILADGMAINSPGSSMQAMAQMRIAQSNDTGLAKVLETYGFKIGTDLIMDRQASVPGVMDIGGRRALVSAPMFVGVQIDKTPGLSVLDGIRGMVFPFGSSVDLTGPLSGGKVPAGAQLWKLASSGPTSWKHSGFMLISADAKVEESNEHGPFAFGYAYQGTLKSAFVTGPAAGVSSPNQPLSESAKPVRLVVVGDSDFASDEYVQLSRFFGFYAAGAQMLYNSIGWTVEDEALIPLRSKNMDARQITVSSDGKASALKWGNILGLPVAFCAYGLVRWRLRRAARANQTI